MSAHLTQQLTGRRVLVIEDQYLIAMEIAEALEEAGAEIVGPTGSVSSAAKPIHDDGFDLAVVDVQLRDGEAYPLVDELQKARIPMVFLTGYERPQLRREYRGLPHVIKPFEPKQLVSALAEVNQGNAQLGTTARIAKQ
jgi:CheY-like chemotaxis protein